LRDHFPKEGPLRDRASFFWIEAARFEQIAVTERQGKLSTNFVRLAEGESSNMPCQLAKLFGAGWRHPSEGSVNVADEVSEYESVLLVRLSGGSAMQIQLDAEPGRVLIRTVPIAKARQLEGDPPWQMASDSQLRAWIQSGSAIWHWLLGKGIDGDTVARRLAESAVAMVSPSRRTSFLASRSRISLSLT
jgi:hypothetical protein